MMMSSVSPSILKVPKANIRPPIPTNLSKIKPSPEITIQEQFNDSDFFSRINKENGIETMKEDNF